MDRRANPSIPTTLVTLTDLLEKNPDLPMDLHAALTRVAGFLSGVYEQNRWPDAHHPLRPADVPDRVYKRIRQRIARAIVATSA